MPKVSVVIPTHNRAGYLKEAIDSVLNQTHKDVEIIVVDDGSKDNTKQVLAPYINDRAIQYIYQERRGASAARNAGLKKASGQFIKFLDSDDYLFAQQLEKQLKEIADQKDLLSLSDYLLLKADGQKVVMGVFLVPQERQLSSFIEANRGVIHAFLTPKHLIDRVGGFDEDLNSCEDLDLWLRILASGAHIKHLAFTGCCYRMVNTGLSWDLQDMFIQKCKVYEKVNRSASGQKDLPVHLVESLLAINTQLLNECLVRKMDQGKLLPSTLGMTAQLYDRKKTGAFRFLYKALGIENYLRLLMALKQLKNRGYADQIINGSYQWKH